VPPEPLEGMTFHAFGDKVPRFGPDAFVQVDATVIGDVVPEEGATVRPSAAQDRPYPPCSLPVGSPARWCAS